ncbi:iron-containing alcohol dehydrogenase [Virgibacillus sp. MSP4-1]|uniref:iron-containing alcohol dehydrogenase n=1 Tax=Virgibacillus sp. MSP4-1 TaxID=2700081 RepID=UPI00039DF2BF|nr:iron-containing alcohol dehydrogenase [Virgibacillus sp. MSP4-1]QHS23441.1 iron-containing alcohol dehydrogenase [Virgibacillus sp. MSP4-1]
MNSFKFQNPTKLLFGKGQLNTLPKEVARYGNRILLVYGSESILRNGIYDNVTSILNKIGAEVHELPGVKGNPRVTTVQEGIDICKEENIEFILAIGGGSVIDCSKAIAVGAKSDSNIWDIITKKAKLEGALPLGTILTMAATGSEMNKASVITNWDLNEKITWGSSIVYPKFSILDPEHTYSVPQKQTVYGLVDIMAHVMEQYFHNTTNTPVQDSICESLLKIVIETAPKVLEDPENYEFRETIMLCGTMAMNDMISMGTRSDWALHHIEHAVSAVHDIPHAAGIAILFPHWMQYVVEKDIPRFRQFAVNVFNAEGSGKSDLLIALEGIERLQYLWKSIGAPSTLKEFNINEDKFDIIADKAVSMFPVNSNFVKLDKEDVLNILHMSL